MTPRCSTIGLPTLCACLCLWASCPGFAAEDLPARARPLARAHAHNDYEHTRPLVDALEQGFCNVEADIWLVEGELRVAHDLADAKPGRTLQKMYLDPLRARVMENAGRVFRDGPPFTLLVDVKSDATNTYRILRPLLEGYRTILTRFEPDRTVTNAVTVIVSGNRTREWMAQEPVRLAAYDGRLQDLENSAATGTMATPHLIPLISDNWNLHFRWRARAGEAAMPQEERAKLRQWVQQAHSQGRRVRFWAIPDTRAAWQELADAGVDLINTDDLAGLGQFLRGQ